MRRANCSKREEELKKRLGKELYAKRLSIENEREREFHAVFSTKFTFFKLKLIRPLQRLFLRVFKLDRMGRKEFLSPVIVENHVKIGDRLPTSFNGFRILQLSDLHIDIDKFLIHSISKAVKKAKYDLCVFTGDYRNKTVGSYNKTMELMDKLRKSIRGIPIAILGNHDYISMVPYLEESGYKVLLNESVEIEKGTDKIAIIGIDDPVIFRTNNIKKAMEGLDDDIVKILLSHSPRTYTEAEKLGVNILFAGHTHGGQICLPGGKAVIGNDSSPKEFLKGSWRFKNLIGFTSVGCGASGLPIRLNCPPEIVIHILEK